MPPLKNIGKIEIMAKANVDPEELRRFAKELNHFNTEVESLVGRVRAKLRQLEQKWDDQEQRKFIAEFDMSIKSLSHFLEIIEAICSVFDPKSQAY